MATTGYVKGRAIGIYIDGNLIAYGTSGSFEGSTNTMDVGNNSSGGSREILPDEKSYTVNFSGKMRFDATHGLDEVITAHEAQSQVVVKIASGTSGDMYLQVNGYFSSFNYTADYGDTAVFSFTVDGDGVLTHNSGYETESSAIFSAMTTEPDSTRKGYINTLVAALKDAGVWNKLDRLWVFAAHAEDSSLLDWIHPTVGGNACTNVSSTSFTIDEGYTGDGSADYLNTNFNPATDAINYTKDSAMSAVYNRTNDLSNGDLLFGVNDGTNYSQLMTWSSTDLRIYINDASSNYMVYAYTDIKGLLVNNRPDSSKHEFFKNGLLVATAASGSYNLPNGDMYILGSNYNGSLTNPSLNQISIKAEGSGLNATEHLALNTAIESYMDSIGKGVQS